jgi:hypothetical protein
VIGDLLGGEVGGDWMVANLFGYGLYGKKLQLLSCPAEFRMRWDAGFTL